MIEFIQTEYGNVSSEFCARPLNQICVDKDGVQTGPFGSQLHKADYVDNGTPIITVEHLDSGFINGDNAPQVSEIDRQRLIKYTLKEGDIVFSRVGSVDRRSLVRENENGWMFSGRCLRVRANKKIIDPRYLSYFFGSETFKTHIRSIAVGATMPSINTKILSDIRIFYPPLPEQKAIAHILGTLDDKIELNRKMNQTLEAMAQALFKSWFVDFDPVMDNALATGNNIPDELQAMADKRALVPHSKKLISKSPKLAKEFPSSFAFNETLGKWIPEGWEVKRLGDASTVVGGGTPSTKVEEYFCENGIPWLSPKDLSGYNWKYISKGATDITETGLKNSSAKLMPKGTVLFSSRAPIGYIAIAENEVSTNQGFKSLVPNKGIPTEYLFQFLKANTDKIDSIASGSTFKEVSGSALKGIEIIIPSIQVLKEFSKVLSASNRRALVIQKETETLTLLRNRLLPELISGRVRVKEEIINNF